MILSDSAILDALDAGQIVIDPFDRKALGGNSYDVHLSPHLKVYPPVSGRQWFGPGQAYQMLDVAQAPVAEDLEIPPEGLVLEPGTLYLASTVEYTETHAHVPVLDGKSSVGRLGIAIHITAGFGDVGFCNHWTMELFVINPVRVRAGMPIGQLRYHTVQGEVTRPYARKQGAKYTQRDPRPQESRMYKNFEEKP